MRQLTLKADDIFDNFTQTSLYFDKVYACIKEGAVFCQ